MDVGEGKHSTNLYLIKKSSGFVVEQPHRLFLYFLGKEKDDK